MTTIPTVPSTGAGSGSGTQPPTRLFVVTTPASAIEAARTTRRGAAPLTVTNTSGRALRARARLVSENQASAGWFSFAGEGTTAVSGSAGTTGAAAPGAEVEWDMAVDETRQFQVQFAAPSDAPQGLYRVRPELWHVADPATTLAQGPTISVTLPAPEVKRQTPWWVWLIPVVLIVVLVSAVFGWMWNDGQAEARAASATATAESATATAVAVGGASAAATATAQAATQQRINRYTGTWVNSDKTNANITRLEISSANQSVTVKMRGKAIDVIGSGGGWAQKACATSECDLGKPSTIKYTSDPISAEIETVSPLVHRLTLTVTPDQKVLSAVDQVQLRGSVVHTSQYVFSRQTPSRGIFDLKAPFDQLLAR